MGACFRLNHDLVRAHFTEAHLPDQEAEGRVVEALTGLVPKTRDGQADWLHDPDRAAVYYARAYLAAHAAAAGVLDPLLEDPAFLAAADPARLLPTLGTATSDAAREAAGAYQLAAHRLVDAARAGVRHAAAQLELTARQNGADELADHSGRLDLPFHASWARWRRQTPHRVLGGEDGPVRAVAVGAVGGRPVAVTGGHEGTARVWDLATGGRVAELRGDLLSVSAVAVGAVGGRAVAVTGSRDGTARVWDLATGGRVAELRGHDGAVSAVAVGEVGGRAVAVTGSEDRTARVWDLATGDPVGGPLRGHDGAVRAVAAGEAGGRAVAVTGSDDRTARVWDLAADRTQTGEPLVIHTGGSVSAVATAPGGVVVIGGDHGLVALTLEAPSRERPARLAAR